MPGVRRGNSEGGVANIVLHPLVFPVLCHLQPEHGLVEFPRLRDVFDGINGECDGFDHVCFTSTFTGSLMCRSRCGNGISMPCCLNLSQIAKLSWLSSVPCRCVMSATHTRSSNCSALSPN